MIFIQNNTILKSGTRSNLYSKPTYKYIATLFDDVNEVIINNEERLLYPHQIVITENSPSKGTVTNSYFKSYYWLIEVLYNETKLFVNSKEAINKNTEVYLDFKI